MSSNEKDTDKELENLTSDLLDMSGVPGAEEKQPLEPFELKEVAGGDLDNRDSDMKDDYRSARESIHQQQQMITELAQLTLETARSTNSPKLVDAFSSLMGRLTDVNQKMMDHHKATLAAGAKTSSGTGEGEKKVSNTQNNFYMTPTEMMSEIGTQYEADAMKQDEDDGTSDSGNSSDQ